MEGRSEDRLWLEIQISTLDLPSGLPWQGEGGGRGERGGAGRGEGWGDGW